MEKKFFNSKENYERQKAKQVSRSKAQKKADKEHILKITKEERERLSLALARAEILEIDLRIKDILDRMKERNIHISWADLERKY